jgi:hypothetical protein
LEMGLRNCLSRLTSNCNPPDLCLPTRITGVSQRLLASNLLLRNRVIALSTS